MVTCPAGHSSRTGPYMSTLASLKSFLNMVTIVILSKCKSDHITSLSFTRIFKYLLITLRKEPTALDRACTVWLQGLVSRFSAAPSHPVPQWLSGCHHTTHLLGSQTPCSILSKGFCTQLFCLPRKRFPSPRSVLNFESLFRCQLKSYFFRKAFPNYAKSPIWALLHGAYHSFNFTFAMSLFNYNLSPTVDYEFQDSWNLLTIVTLVPNTVPSTQEIVNKYLWINEWIKVSNSGLLLLKNKN